VFEIAEGERSARRGTAETQIFGKSRELWHGLYGKSMEIMVNMDLLWGKT